MCSVKFILQEEDKNILNEDEINQIYEFIESKEII